MDYEGSALMNGLQLRSLRKLGLTLHLTLPLQDKPTTCIQQLIDLQSLNLRFVDENSNPHDLKLGNCLKEFNKLSSLYFFGKLELTSLNKLPKQPC